MKVFFALLLIANIGFAVFQFLVPYEQMFGESAKIPPAEELVLLSEAGIEVIEQAEQAEVVASAPTPVPVPEPEPAETETSEAEAPEAPVSQVLVTEDVSDKRVCYTIGPLTDRARAIEISGRYSGKEIPTALRSSQEKQYRGMMVYIDGHDSRDAALQTASDLSAKGLRDHIIINEPGRPYLLSLGVFGLKKNAESLLRRAQGLGFDAKIEPRYRERVIYWVYAEQSSEDELEQLLKQPELEDGISQIPTQCLPA